MQRFFARVMVVLLHGVSGMLTPGLAMVLAAISAYWIVMGIMALVSLISGCVMSSDPFAARTPPGVVSADGGDGGTVEDAAIVEDGGTVEDAAIVEDGGTFEDAAIVEDGGTFEDATIVEDGGTFEDGCQAEGEPCARAESQPNGDGTITLCVTCLGEPSIVHCGSTGSGPWTCDAALACRSASVGWDACEP